MLLYCRQLDFICFQSLFVFEFVRLHGYDSLEKVLGEYMTDVGMSVFKNVSVIQKLFKVFVGLLQIYED